MAAKKRIYLCTDIHTNNGKIEGEHYVVLVIEGRDRVVYPALKAVLRLKLKLKKECGLNFTFVQVEGDKLLRGQYGAYRKGYWVGA